MSVVGCRARLLHVLSWKDYCVNVRMSTLDVSVVRRNVNRSSYILPTGLGFVVHKTFLEQNSIAAFSLTAAEA